MSWWPELDGSFAGPLRQFFLEQINTGRIKQAGGSVPVTPIELKSPSHSMKMPMAFLGVGKDRDKSLKRVIMEEGFERLESTSLILKAWAACPLLAIAVCFLFNLSVER
jgi:hypothetical protein